MIVALLSDFGTRDHYVGAMKAVVLGVCAEATLVDITHEIPPQDILTGALELAAAYRYFPPGTVFLCVVDPGVGSSRRAIAASAGAYYFVGPDNGILSLALQDAGPSAQVVELAERKFARRTISRTFEGRDRFAPAAGWLARGTALSAFGPSVADPEILHVPAARSTSAGIEGEVLRVDRFGNLITNIADEMIQALGDRVDVVIGSRRIAKIVPTYAASAPNELCALIGSSGHLEIAVSGGNAAAVLSLGRGAAVMIRRGAADS